VLAMVCLNFRVRVERSSWRTPSILSR